MNRKDTFLTTKYKGHYIHSHSEHQVFGEILEVVEAQNAKTHEVRLCNTILGAKRLITKWCKDESKT